MEHPQIKRNVTVGQVRDWSGHIYHQHQWRQIKPEQVKLAAMRIEPSGLFFADGKTWMPYQYPGYAVISMVDNNPGNEGLAPLLVNIQNELQFNLQPLNGFYMLPAESFHLTIANTLSAERLTEHILATGIDEIYPSCISHAFNNAFATKKPQPIRMRLIGLAVYGTRIGALGIFETDADYKRIIDFRSGFYEDGELQRIGVKMTRTFMGHITLAYAEQKLNKNQRSHLAATINEINEQVFANKHYFLISQAELRKYNHLAAFNAVDGYPIYRFTL